MQTKANKPARVRVAKPAAPEAAKPVTPEATADRQAERVAAREAIAAFYGTGSIPFKAASDTFAPFRTDKAAKRATVRQAALVAAMLISGDNIKPDGTFTRGGFEHNGKRVQPETGCLSDMHGRLVSHVSGPLAGKQARDSVFKLDLVAARAEISSLLGDKLGKAALAKLDQLAA